MHIRSVKIQRAGHYGFTGEKLDPSKPFICTVETDSTDGKMELTLSPVLSQRVLEIVAEELAASARETAENMIAAVFTTSGTLIEAPVEAAPADLDDEIPF